MTETILHANCRLELQDFDLSISFEAGRELVVLFGPSGAGKSLTLKTLAGLKTPTEGEIVLHGRVLYSESDGINLMPQERHVGYVPQSYALLPHRSIRENIRYGLSALSREESESRTNDLLVQMNLTSISEKKPSEVSGGQRQRAALARALVRQPELLLMDEPFGALEETLRRRLGGELQKLQETFRIPTILVTHSLREAYSLAETMVVIDEGSMIQQGPPGDVFQKPHNRQVAHLLGMTNLLSVKVQNGVGGIVKCSWAGYPLSVRSDTALDPGEERILGIRPENILLGRPDQTPTSYSGNTLHGVVVAYEPDGYEAVITTDILDAKNQRTHEKLIARTWVRDVQRLNLKIGEKIFLGFAAEDAWLLADERD